MIAFIGSVFSPYYAMARDYEAGDPLNFCALNVALYGPRTKRWAMTERGRAALHRSADRLDIGPSSLTWAGGTLAVTVDERTTPVPLRLRGTIRLHADTLTESAFTLTADGQHLWQPLVPSAHVEVDFPAAGMRWSGTGYLDVNHGHAPLETGFTRWDWSRAPLTGGRTALLYDTHEAGGGGRQNLALLCGRDGTMQALQVPAAAALPRTRWLMPRYTRGDPGASPRVVRTLEDTPFYARSVVRNRLANEDVLAMHESLSLTRFRHPATQFMLPYRMPRR